MSAATRRLTRSNRKTVHYDESSDVEQDQDAYIPSEQDKENAPNHVTKSSTKRKNSVTTTTTTTTNTTTSKKRRTSVTINHSRCLHQQQQQQPQSKRGRKGKGKKRQEDLEDDWEENYLYQALSSPEINVVDLAQEWVETYEEESILNTTDSTTITLLMNLILRSCGSFHLFQPHDLANLESATSTVEELTLAFGNQSTHKFPFKLVPVFKKNVLQFFQHIIEICHEKGLLYPPYTQHSEEEEDSLKQSPLMSYLITWMTSLTGSAIRALRFTSTEISMIIQLELSKIGKSITTNLSRLRKHLTKLADERSTKFKTITSTIANYESQLDTLNEYFDDLASVVVSQRYKDFDPQIRLIVVKYLIDTVIAYPSYFCQSQFLKYFGWLLSDPVNQVRNEITRDLLKLYRLNKNQEIVSGLTQFSTKFKSQFIAMCEVDVDANVRGNCCGILTEMIKMGFLDGKDKHSVIRAFPFGATTKLKLQTEFVKFIQMAMEENVNFVLEKNQLIFENDRYILRDHDVKDILLIKVLAQELSFLVEKEEPLEVIFESAAMSQLYFTKLRLFLDYLLTDIAELRKDKGVNDDEEEIEIEGQDPDLDQIKQLVQLDDLEKLTLLKAIHGIIKAVMMKKTNKQGGVSREEEEEVKSTIITQFIDYIPKLQIFCSKSNNRYKIFISAWQDLIDDKHNCIFNYYIKLDKIDSYESTIVSILQYFYEFSLVDEFQPFFEKLFNLRGLTESIKLEIQRIVDELVENTTIYLRDNQQEEEEQQEDIQNDSLIDMDHDFVLWTNRQKHVIKLCREVSILVQKIKLIGNYVNIANLEKIDDLIYQFNNRILNKFDLNVVLNQWKHNFILQLPKFTQAFIAIIELVFIIGGWKFEKIIDIPQQDQHQIDIELELEMVGDVVSNLIRYIDELKELNEGDHTPGDLGKLIDFKCQLIYQYINLMISFRLFYIKFQDDNDFKHFKVYFRLNKSVIMIKQDLQMELLEMFLIKEVKLANVLEIELDRDDEEGVHYEEYLEKELPVEEESTVFSENEDEDDDEKTQRHEKQQRLLKAKQEQLKQDEIWKLEKDLAVYSLKLISLVKLQLISNNVYQRLKKNAGQLGEVYYKLIEQEKVVENRYEDGEADVNANELTDLGIDVGVDTTIQGEVENAEVVNDNESGVADICNDGDKEQDVSMDLQLELDV